MIARLRTVSDDPFLTGVIFVLVATLGLSVKAIFIKFVYLADPGIDAISILALRFMLAVPFFAVLLMYARRQPHSVRLNRRHTLHFLLLGMVGFYLSAILDFSALAYISASLERLILFLYPTFVVVISLFIRPQEVTRRVLLALLVTYSGVVLVFADQWAMIDASMLRGIWMVLGAAIVFAGYTVASAGAIRNFGSIRFTTYAMFAASIATLGHAFAIHGTAFLGHTADIYLIILLMAVFSTVLPLLLMAEGVRRIGASTSSIVATTGPMITISLAVVLLDEVVGPLQLLGGMIIMFGVYMVSRRRA